MIRTWIGLALLWMLLGTVYAQEQQIGVRYSQFTTLVFPADIIDLEIGSAAYTPKIKGKYLLLKAKNKHVAPTSLMVRYGEEKQGYVLELIPDHQAPLVFTIQEIRPSLGQATVEAPSIAELFAHQPQSYCTLGLKKQGMTLMVTNILHQGNTTYLRLFIDNQTSLPCDLSQATFEYIYVLRRFLFFKKAQRKVVAPLYTPMPIELPAYSSAYFVLAIPAHASADGLSVSFGAQEGVGSYQIYIPSKVLLQADSKSARAKGIPSLDKARPSITGKKRA